MYAEPKKDPKNLFLQLFSILALYVSFSSLLALLFSLINLRWGRIGYFTSVWGMRLELSILLIGFAAYVWSCFQIRKTAQPTRKFFVYLTLFLAGILIAGDAISLLYYGLSGGVTIAFSLKVLTLFVLASGVAYFYFIEGKKGANNRQFKAYIGSGAVIVIFALVCAFYSVGSPVQVKLANQDLRRAGDLSQIQNQINVYYQQNKRLPISLAELNNAVQGYKLPVDPVSQKPYDYQVVSAGSFTLCADFVLPSSAAIEKLVGADFWPHTQGHVCFIRKVLSTPKFIN